MVNKNLLLSSMSSLSSTGSISRICSQSGDSRYISVAILFLDLKFKRRYVESNKNIQKIWKSAAQLREILQLGSLGKIGSPPLPLTPQTALNCHLFSGKNLSRLSRCLSVAAKFGWVQYVKLKGCREIYFTVERHSLFARRKKNDHVRSLK